MYLFSPINTQIRQILNAFSCYSLLRQYYWLYVLNCILHSISLVSCCFSFSFDASTLHSSLRLREKPTIHFAVFKVVYSNLSFDPVHHSHIHKWVLIKSDSGIITQTMKDSTFIESSLVVDGPLQEMEFGIRKANIFW